MTEQYEGPTPEQVGDLITSITVQSKEIAALRKETADQSAALDEAKVLVKRSRIKIVVGIVVGVCGLLVASGAGVIAYNANNSANEAKASADSAQASADASQKKFDAFIVNRTQARIANCQNINEFNAKQAGVWYGILDKFAKPSATPKESTGREAFRKFIGGVFAPQDCSIEAIEARLKPQTNGTTGG